MLPNISLLSEILYDNTSPKDGFCQFDSNQPIVYPLLLVILSSLSWIGSGLLIIGFLKYKKLRSQPGDIVFGISCGDFILSTHWMISGAAALINENLSENCAFCITNSVFSTSAGILEYCYNISLCIYLVQSLKNALKSSRVPRRSLHVVTLLFTFTTTLILLCMGKLGKTLFGTCSLKYISGSITAFMGPIIVLIYAIVAFYTIYFIRKYAPQCEKADHNVASFLNYYSKYVWWSTIIWSVYSFAFLVASLIFKTEGDSIDPGYPMKVISTLGNISKLSTPLILARIRYKDKAIKSTMRKLIFFWRYNNQKKSSTYARGIDLNSQIGNPILPQDFDYSLEEPNHTMGPGILAKDLRIQLTYTILSGILYTLKMVKEDNVPINPKSVVAHPKGYTTPRNCEISKEIVQESLPQLDFSGYTTFRGAFKFHAPYLFNHLLKQDGHFIDMEKSLDLSVNHEAIRKASGADGGKSGEFFFFSDDKKIIVKTISTMELKKLLEVLPHYLDYLCDNKDSLIAKYYGVFTMTRENIGEEEHFVVMRNVCGISSKYVDRQYDMKGSTFDREVLKNQSILNISELRSKGTLKDTDFFKYDHQLAINPKLAERFVHVMERDANFFRDRNLIDYSLAVFVVNKQRCKEQENEVPMSANYHELCSMQSTTDPEIWYNIGIIDYLQPYNFGKMMEKSFKKIIKFDLNLDTSSQPPYIYASRFTQFAKRLVSGRTTSVPLV